MNTKTQLTQPNVPSNNSQSQALHEQLALKRLKELGEAAEASSNSVPAEPAAQGWLWQSPAAIWIALFRRTELTRELAPGQLPTRWHEIEELRAQRAMQLR